MLVHLKEIVRDATRRGYAVGAFNTVNLEVTLAIVRAAVAVKSPVIVQVSEGTIRYAGLKPITHIVKTIAKNLAIGVPVALHLDHGRSFHAVTECIDAGFSSIHIDASDQPFDENVAVTREAVRYAHKSGAWAQGELGHIFGQEGVTRVAVPDDPAVYMTDPLRVREFIRATGIDTLAISVGTLHGQYRGRERVDLERLAAIARRVRLPLVLHGASGALPQEVRLAVRRGVRIINIDTELRIAFTQALRRSLRSMRARYDLRKYLGPATDAIQRTVEDKMRLFGSAGKAKIRSIRRR